MNRWLKWLPPAPAPMAQAGADPAGSPRGLVRVPIKAKLSVAVIVLLVFTIAALSYVILHRQTEQLYDQIVRTGIVSIGYIESNARVPILSDDTIRLNQLVSEVASLEEFIYAAIVDRQDTVMAHSNLERVGEPFPGFPGRSGLRREEGVTYFNYTDASGSRVLNLTTPVTYQDKTLGEVHLGVSLDFINRQITAATSFIVLLGAISVVAGIAVAVSLSVGFSRPISRLVEATREIGQGRFDHRVPVGRNDELGDLARAFNSMAEGLGQKDLMQQSFGRYVSPEIVELILADPEHQILKGRRSQATVIFTDVRGFTSYSESHQPEQIVEALNEYFEIATKWILEYGGYVDKFIGDAVMGVFGVPVPRPDHARRAVRACAAMQKELEEHASRNEVAAKVGTGVNSGLVISGNIGSQVKTEYTVIGDNVNIASRLTGLARSGQVIISGSTYELAKDIVAVQPQEARRVKGRSKAIQSFLVTAVRPEPQE